MAKLPFLKTIDVKLGALLTRPRHYAAVGGLAMASLGIGGAALFQEPVQPEAQSINNQKDEPNNATLKLANMWEQSAITNGKTDYFSLNDTTYTQNAKTLEQQAFKYYGPYALDLRQLELAGFVYNDSKTGKWEWSDKEVNGVKVDSRQAFLNLDHDAHLEVFKSFVYRATEEYIAFEPNPVSSELILYLLSSGNRSAMQEILYNEDSLNDRFTLKGEMPTNLALADAFDSADLQEQLDINYEIPEDHVSNQTIDYTADAHAETQELPLAPSYSRDIEAPTIVKEPSTVVASPQPAAEQQLQTFIEKELAKRHLKPHSKANSLLEAVRTNQWKGQPRLNGMFEDSRGTKRYTELGLSMDDLKIAGYLVKEKGGAYIWSESSGVHTALGVSYQSYASNWKKHANEARNAFLDKAQYTIESINNQYMQKLWNNVVQPSALDNFIGAEGYMVDGKTLTIDATHILALTRFHGHKATKSFLASADRSHPNITPQMAETLSTFTHLSHKLDLDILPIRTFIGEGNQTFRIIDMRKQFKVEDMKDDAYPIMLETKAFRESSYKLDVGTKYIGYYQINKKYLEEKYLNQHNVAHCTNHTIADFKKNQDLQTAIIRDYHAETARQVESKGLTHFTPYVMNTNLVEFEVHNPKVDVQSSIILSPEKLKHAKLLSAGTGKEEFGFQVGAVYMLPGKLKATVTDVGTRTRQVNALGLVSMSHLGGAGNISKTFNTQNSIKEQVFSDGNKTPVSEYFFLTDHSINERNLAQAKQNPHFNVPEKDGKLDPKFQTNEVLKAMDKGLKYQQSIPNRPKFDEAAYKRFNQSMPVAAISHDTPWSQKVKLSNLPDASIAIS